MTHRKPRRTWEVAAMPLWVRVGLYGTEHHGQRLAPGELRRTLDPVATARDVSRAIRRAVEAGLLAHDSTARCLYTTLDRTARP